ncbi:Sigma factor sigB regulation protein rsbQ, regulator of RsbP phosphatase [Modestobacter italicus]|uniref:Sigma factor sigB regulation protein rsbQ, regulator of RsbP phosphatase n=1 Tax=Modestobacter italicus (strain DSM 44449 / CECT 9708 / BC 501) TaxID=2732864 RepID=I4F0L3_MODI5|nr:alpha/beta hydrolase [Modestobacter marinus]CCH89176.1 Sigma factor sigB regulation protein rsbQ, regulator of RsbP phosphatase [Modestobacter marinus]
MLTIDATGHNAGAATRNNVTVTGRPDGPVLLFAHGFGCDQDMWQRVVPVFAEDHRIVLFDHVGAGRSDLSAYDRTKYSTLDGYAADLLQICDELDLRDVILIAHSVSAMMAVVAAVAEPARFSRLVLVAPSPRYIDDPADGYIGGFSAEDIEGLLESLETNYFAWAAAMAPMVMGNPDAPELGDELAGRFCATDPDIAGEFARVTFLSDTRHLLPQVTTPALVLQCSQDMLASTQVGDYVHRNLAGSTLVQLAATGHCPQVSAPAETSAAIRDYLSAAR